MTGILDALFPPKGDVSGRQLESGPWLAEEWHSPEAVGHKIKLPQITPERSRRPLFYKNSESEWLILSVPHAFLQHPKKNFQSPPTTCTTIMGRRNKHFVLAITEKDQNKGG